VGIGTEREISKQLRSYDARFGIDRYVVRVAALEQARRVICGPTRS
jgi:hypothetical protein